MLLSSLFIALFTIIKGIPHISAVCNKVGIEGIVSSPQYNGEYSIVDSTTCFYKRTWGKQGDGFIYYKETETSWVGWVIGDGLCSSQYRVRGSESGGEDPVSVEKWEEYTDGNRWLHNDDILFQCKDISGLSPGMIMVYIALGVTILAMLCCCATACCCNDYCNHHSQGINAPSGDNNDNISLSMDQLPTYEEGLNMPRSRANTVDSHYGNQAFASETEVNESARVTTQTPPRYVDAIHMPVLAESPIMPHRQVEMRSSSSTNTLRRNNTCPSLNGSVSFIGDDTITELGAGCTRPEQNGHSLEERDRDICGPQRQIIRSLSPDDGSSEVPNGGVANYAFISL